VELIIDNVRPGRSADEVARAARRGHAAVGSEIYFQEVYGEATGLSFPPTLVESPTVIAAGVTLRLEPGMTFHLPIAMRRPGEFCVGLSETIAVTETGCEVLTEQTRDVVIIHP
jgi:Xaa-Pro dipeptidase